MTICKYPASSICFSVYFQSHNTYFRLWIRSKTPADDPAPQQIGYMSVLPVCLKNEGFLTPEYFENFDETLRKFNVMIGQQAIPGRYLTVSFL